MNSAALRFLVWSGMPLLAIPSLTDAFAAGAASAVVPSAAASEKSPVNSDAAPRPWVVYLVQHTHTDIGYTRPQSEILPEHIRFIDDVLDCCDRTDSYPDDAKYRWTCESSWVVREYLRCRPPEQIERLRKRVAEGRVEVTAMLLNMSEIATESSLAASLQAIRELKEKLGTPVQLAMQNDVNGIAWCLADYFSDCGVNYLTMGINKTRSLLPFDMPTVFWWESPAGKRVLAFRADHYHTANTWKIHEGRIETLEPHLRNYLRSLENKGYPFDRVAVQYSGFRTDNSPPSTVACDVVKAWNETHETPKLRMATASEFMKDVASRQTDSLPVYRVAWPDWWTDGFGSAARETAQSRETHTHLQVDQALLAMTLLNGGQLPKVAMDRIAAVQEDLLFYDEHTFGASQSISDPTAESTIVQWGQKSSYAWDAVKQAGLLREEAIGVLQDKLPRAEVPLLVVLNTLNWKRSGLSTVFIPYEILPSDREARFSDAQTGEVVPACRAWGSRGGAYWAVWAKDVPPFGHKSYRLQAEDVKTLAPEEPVPPAHTLDNTFYNITIAPETGAITHLYDKETGLELVDPGCPWNLGQIIYERCPERAKFQPEAFQRTTVRNVKLKEGLDNPIYKSLRIQADLDDCAEPGSVRAEIRLYKTEKKIELRFGLRKRPVSEPEALYVAFPFQSRSGRIIYEAQGGIVEPGKDQLPGSSSDWHTVQSFVAVRNDHGQIILGSDQVPLVQYGDLNLGKWQPVARVDKPYVYSWVMNNYWYTNFKAAQQGEFQWSYYLTSNRDTHNGQAVRFGWGARVPLIARVFPPGKTDTGRLSDALLQCDAPNLLLVEARPDQDGTSVMLHWREVEGKPASIDLGRQPFSGKLATIEEVNVLGETLRQGASVISFAPFEVKFVRLRCK